MSVSGIGSFGGSVSDFGASGAAGGGPVAPQLAGVEGLRRVASGAAELTVGARGEDVRALQRALVDLGADIVADGAYGPKTAAALKIHQGEAGLPETGVLDAATLAALDRRLFGITDGSGRGDTSAVLVAPQLASEPTLLSVARGQRSLAHGSRGDAVRTLQEALNLTGAGLATDGAYGPGTLAAVRSLQTEAGLRPTGIVDSDTLLALDRKLMGVSPRPGAPAPRPAPAPAPDPMDRTGTGYFTDADLLPAGPRTVTRNPSDVSAASTADVAAAREEAAEHASATAAAHARLSLSERAAYDRVRAALTGPGDEGAARLGEVSGAALDALLRRGALTGAKDSYGGATLLAQLDRLASQPLTTGVDRRTLLAELVRECEDPVRMNQHRRGTCTMTSSTIILATTRPAEYVRLVADLAAPAGSARLRNGDTILREPDWANSTDGGRSTSGRLIWPALMEYGNGSRTYNNATGKHSDGREGLPQSAVSDVLHALTGRAYETKSATGFLGMERREAALEDIRGALRRGDMVPICMEFYGIGVHEVVVLRSDPVFIEIINPWGQEETLEADEFKRRLIDYSVPR